MSERRTPQTTDATAAGTATEPTHGTVLAGQAMAYRSRAEDTAPLADAPAADGGAGAQTAGPRTFLQQVVRDTLSNTRARLGTVWIGVLMFFACFAPFLANSHPVAMKAGGVWSSPMYRHLGAADVVLPAVFVTAAVLLVRRRLSAGRGLALVLWVAAVVFLFAGTPGFFDYFRARAGGGGGALAGAAKAWAGAWFLGTVTAGVFLGVLAYAALAPLFLIPRRAAVVTGAALAPLLLLLVLAPIRPPENVTYERYREMQAAGQTQAVVRTVIPYSPTDRLRDQPESRLTPPDRRHWAGTDDFGADLLSRMIHGARIALSIGFIATGIALVIGVLVGGLMGYFAGAIDLIGMRLIEILEAIPTLVLLIVITASYGRNLYLMMAVIGLLRWTGDARFIRAEFLRLRKQDFVQAAVASGLPRTSILFRHMLPNGISPVLVSASFGVASAILLESTLSFLGLGLVDEPSWGAMLNQATRGGAGFNWWIATFPGLLIFLTVFSYNLVGEAIRDALDPKLLKRES
jgi:peptide/nickel transport system permease protein